MQCECCGKEHDGSYASGRFCSSYCAKKYVSINYANTAEKKKQKSEKLKGRKQPNKKKKSEDGYRRQGLTAHRRNEMLRSKQTFEELSDRFKKERLLKEQNNKCAFCEIVFLWMGEILVSHLHHKDANRANKSRSNCELLCPNCHSITKNWGFKNRHHTEGSKKRIGLNSKVQEVWDRKKGRI
jgi:5-methylcytosine-specific restriction endonuclease McrA